MKICFWGDISGALLGNTSGGGELQIAVLAKALAKIGHEVVIVDYNIDKEFQTDDGIKVCPVKNWNKGVRFIRTFTHRLPHLYATLRNQNADVYYCRIRNFRHILAYWAARKVKAKFILGIASDLDISSFMSRWKYYYSSNSHKLWGSMDGIMSEIVYPWLLRNSDSVFVQHEGQKQILLNKNIESFIFPNIIELDRIPNIENQLHTDFVYVGWLDRRKGFPDFYELVNRTPNLKYKVIGPPRDKIGRILYEKLKSFKNVALLGELNHNDTLTHIANAKALISTSPMEGFPNIYIEAWTYGIPVLSLNFDPGGVIERENLGTMAHGNLEKIINAMASVKNTQEFTLNSKSYVERVHFLNENRLNQINCLFQ